MIAARPATGIRLYDAADEPWIAQFLNLVERCLGQPWRVLLERIEHAPLSASGSRVAGIVAALRRVIGGRAERARIARKVRAKVLGHPALDRDARDARIAIAAAELGIEPADVDRLLWADLARERPVVLPHGRPAERTLVGFANLDRIQRAVRRAREVRLRVSGDAHELVRTAGRYGLLASITRAGDATIFHITGPLSLFHATTVYGRALAALVPLLADHPGFVLEISGDYGGTERNLRIEPPLVLPPAPPPRRRAPGPAERLARELGAAGCLVEREPAPIASGEHLLFPDLAVEHAGRRWFVEVLGFSTDEFLTDKLARYAAAGIANVILCIDASRSAPRHAANARVVSYERKISADALLSKLAVPS